MLETVEKMIATSRTMLVDLPNAKQPTEETKLLKDIIYNHRLAQLPGNLGGNGRKQEIRQEIGK